MCLYSHICICWEGCACAYETEIVGLWSSQFVVQLMETHLSLDLSMAIRMCQMPTKPSGSTCLYFPSAWIIGMCCCYTLLFMWIIWIKVSYSCFQIGTLTLDCDIANFCSNNVYQCGGSSGSWGSIYLKINLYNYWAYTQRICGYFILPQSPLLNHVYWCFFYNSPNWKKMYTSLNRQIDKAYALSQCHNSC